ncbi:hypothetical protein EB75_04590 [Mycobacterium sp. ST-F2]|uniref:hypothetical protein n=1 Tax=Mycobacterium sp. ST-F2 TaxID=1490484 RepID=UPI00093DA625|nr:hypothetical protein [Mycobacterium sp. ST-F2]OKH84415.1 hypothetical protein EB75_04590 [Mycobacterium sp. ST-F2]
MADLRVDVEGLRSAGASSGALAAGLTAGAEAGTASTTHASAAGVAAMDAAITSVQSRHSNRLTGQTDALTASSARYESTDSGGGQAINSVSV